LPLDQPNFPRAVRALRLGTVVTGMPGRRVPYKEIAADLRDQIASGRLPPGTQLGSLRALRAQYGVAEGTVQAALRMLRDEGVIETFLGRGSFVLKAPAEPEPSPEYRQLAAVVSRLAARVEVLEALADKRRGAARGKRS
jgi:DNA-binding GntR family transcriptional regulator